MKKQSGISAVEIILIIAVIALASGLAYVYFSRDKDPTAQTTDTSSEQKQELKQEAASEPKLDEKSAELVKSAYDTYLVDFKARDSNAYQKFSQSLTPEYRSRFEGTAPYNPILCGVTAPDKLQYDDPVSENGVTSIIVTGEYPNASSSKISVQVDTEQNKISNIVCNQISE